MNPAATAEPVEIVSGDGVVLRGQLWPGNDFWVILMHDVGDDEDLDCWRSLLPTLRSRAWSILSFDLRGHGASDGDWQPSHAVDDLKAMIDRARTSGAGAIGLVAAGRSAATALAHAGELGVDASVLLSPIDSEQHPSTGLRGMGEARLIIIGAADAEMRQAAERLRNASIGWAAILNLPTTDQGAALLGGELSLHAREHLTGFLAEQYFIAKLRARQPTTR